MWRWYLVDKTAPWEVKDFLRDYYIRYSGPGGMTELGDTGLTEPQIMSLSAHETPAAARVYVKRTEMQRVAAARKRRQFAEGG